MQGINPYAYMQLVAGRLDSMDKKVDVETALEELEYLYEVTDPELQDLASDLMDKLRNKLKSFDAKS